MLSLPNNDALIAFFEAEPELLDGNFKPWIYNELKFTTTRGEDKIIVSIYASFGELSATWIKSGIKLISIKLIDLDSITIHTQNNEEFLTAKGIISDKFVFLKIKLKPGIGIELSHNYISKLI